GSSATTRRTENLNWLNYQLVIQQRLSKCQSVTFSDSSGAYSRRRVKWLADKRRLRQNHANSEINSERLLYEQSASCHSALVGCVSVLANLIPLDYGS